MRGGCICRLVLVLILLSKQVAKETADNFAKCSPEEHIPLDKSMITMAVKAIAVAGMGRIFMDEKEVDKLATMYNEVRFPVDPLNLILCFNRMLMSLFTLFLINIQLHTENALDMN